MEENRQHAEEERTVKTENDMFIYIINSGFLFVVCVSRTIFGNRIGAHVQIEQEKHGNMDAGLKWRVRSSGCYGCYGIARKCTCN